MHQYLRDRTASCALFRRGLSTSIAAFFVASASLASAAASDWYTQAKSDCSGTEPVMAAFVALLPSTLAVHAGAMPAYAETSAAQITKFRAAGDELVLDTLVLNTQQSIDYKHAIDIIASGYAIPYFVDASAAIYSGMVLKPAWIGTGVGLLFTYVLDYLKEPSAAMKAFANFIREGGRLERRWKLLKSANNGLYLVSSMEYAVSVGEENRRFVTAGCSYPVKVDVSEFRTNEKFSNKIIKPHGAVWGVFDIEDNKWDSMQLKFVNQDEEYYYFTEDQIENNQVVGQNIHRISFQGGRWQFKHYDDPAGANFKNLSGVISAF